LYNFFPSDLCRLPLETGPCRGTIPRWYFNARRGRCEEFVFGGCQGNANNFVNEQECAQRCSPNQVKPTESPVVLDREGKTHNASYVHVGQADIVHVLISERLSISSWFLLYV